MGIGDICDGFLQQCMEGLSGGQMLKMRCCGRAGLGWLAHPTPAPVPYARVSVSTGQGSSELCTTKQQT